MHYEMADAGIIRPMNRTLLGALCAVGLLAAPVLHAEGYWLPPGDQRLRDDITLLVDEGVLRLPLMGWPLPMADVRAALQDVNEDTAGTAALQLALARLRSRVAEPANAQDWVIRETAATIGRAPIMRDFGSVAREDGELRSTGGISNDRWGATVSLTAALHAQDGKTLRLDNSDITVRWGNWLFSANTLDRWWGPGQSGSLILSTNARPMANLSVDRNLSTPVDMPVLRWFGPWRASAFISRAEQSRSDLTGSLFMGMRFSFSPVPILELGLSRTAQFCGQNAAGTRPKCGVSQILRSLSGTDNPSGDLLSNDEPGNQMAGFDARVVSPIRALPVAAYAQAIGEDANHRVPVRFLSLVGLESWAQFESGSSLRAQLEYASTNATCTRGDCNPGYAYYNHIFTGGYQYLGRVMGYTTDADSRTVSAALRWSMPDGQVWSLKTRNGTLNSYGAATYSTVSPRRSTYDSAEVGWRGEVRGLDLSVVAGYEKQDPSAGPRRDGPYGFIRWQQRL